MNIPDNYDLWLAYEQAQEELLDELPQCEECGTIIQDDYYYDIDGEILCEDCMCSKYRKKVDDYI